MGHEYTYDAVNMLAEMNDGIVDMMYVYTADDARIATLSVSASGYIATWRIRGLDNKVLREFQEENYAASTQPWTWKRDYVYRDGLLLSSYTTTSTGATKRLDYHLDHLGTPRLITNDAGQQVSVHHYYSFGIEITAAAGETMKFTGHERDYAQYDYLDYMHARYDNPYLGRFLSVDSHPGSPMQPQSWNRFSYVRNNPLRRVDLDGLKEIEFTIRHFIQQQHVFSPFGNVRGDNRGFSLASNASFRTQLTIKVDSVTGRMTQTADTGVSHNFSMGVTRKADPNNWHNEIAATSTRDSSGNVVINATTYASEPFPNTLIGPFTPPIESHTQIVITPDGNTISVAGIRTSSPSMEINATVDGQTFSVYRGAENALFLTGLFNFTPFEVGCANDSCQQTEGPIRDTDDMDTPP